MNRSVIAMRQRSPMISVFLLSAGALGYEILLMRLFSVIQWHHFAYMIISLALLGYGVSGTLVAIMQQRLQRWFDTAYPVSIILFGLSAAGGFLIAQQIPFNAEEILWDSSQIAYLGILFLLLSVPFFFAATAICLAFMRYHRQIAQIYAADLIGAGVGSLGVIALMFLLFPLTALFVIGGLALLAALISLYETGSGNRRPAVFAFTLIAGVALAVLWSNSALKLSPYKELSQTLRVSGTRIIEERSSPLGVVSVVESNTIPFRHAPGLSLNATREPLPQLGLFTDGSNMTVMTRKADSPAQLNYLDYTTSALPYHLKHMDDVLIVGAGGGTDILQARLHHSGHIDAIELNPQLANLVDEQFGDFTDHVLSGEDVDTHIAEVRGFLTSDQQQFDLIQLSLLDAFNASSSGLYALNENYLYTVGAIQLYLRHTKPGGYLALTRWIKIPPRDTLKLFATAVSGLQNLGVQQPGTQLALIRGWQTSTLLIKNGTFTADELQNIRDFTKKRSFDIAWLPGMKSEEANRYNRLASPLFFRTATALLGPQRDAFIRDYKFNLKPATDNRPYFNHFFKWDTFKELFRLRDRGGMPLMEWGYLVLLATLVVATVLSLVLILLPLWVLRQPPPTDSVAVRRRDVVAYFFAIGLAFLFIEIAFMQKFILFLHHPIYSIAVTLTAFLVFAGLGSQWSEKLETHWGRSKTLLYSVAAISAIGLLYLLILGPLFAALPGIGMTLRIIITIALIAPLALAMGMPFPLALSSLGDNARHTIPWAWGINGCASVISASLATLLAINFGFNAVILIALVLYLATPWVFPTPKANKLTA